MVGLVADEFTQEFSPGFHVTVWGYNGSSPGPTIEAIEGDRVRILVTKRLPEPTSVHWHGVLLPSGMSEMEGMSASMPGRRNTAPMMAGRGPYGTIGMGGMFSLLKVRDTLAGHDDPGWYAA